MARWTWAGTNAGRCCTWAMLALSLPRQPFTARLPWLHAAVRWSFLPKCHYCEAACPAPHTSGGVVRWTLTSGLHSLLLMQNRALSVDLFLLEGASGQDPSGVRWTRVDTNTGCGCAWRFHLELFLSSLDSAHSLNARCRPLVFLVLGWQRFGCAVLFYEFTDTRVAPRSSLRAEPLTPLNA